MSDLIDREDVIRIVQDRLNSPYMQNKWQQGACLSILRAIEELPSARPKGKWIKRHGVVNCSNCNHSRWSDCYEDTVMSFNFCPNCGARMKGADDE